MTFPQAAAMTQPRASVPSGKAPKLRADADAVFAAIDGQRIGTRRVRGRVDIFGIHHHDGRWWVQFHVSGDRAYMATVCLNDHQLPNVLGAIELMCEVQDAVAFNGKAVVVSTYVRMGPRARDVLGLLKDPVPIADRRTGGTRRKTRGGRRRTDG
jgi:hypothetical protein